MKDVFVSTPFRVVSVGQTKSDNAAYLMIMSSSPGILSGDHYDITIKVEENARLQLQSQSYQRLFNMDGEASQHMQILLDKNTAFAFVPHPVVPHENSTFRSTNKVTLSEGCEFLLSEIITCGRKHHGEEFKYTHFQNLTEVRYGERLILKDNVLLQPGLMPLSSIGQMENFTHQGTLMYINTKNKPADQLIEHFYTLMENNSSIEFGISAMQHDGFVLRCLANGAEDIFKCFQRVQQFIWEEN